MNQAHISKGGRVESFMASLQGVLEVCRTNLPPCVRKPLMGDAFMGAGEAPSLFLKLEYFREIFFLGKNPFRNAQKNLVRLFDFLLSDLMSESLDDSSQS